MHRILRKLKAKSDWEYIGGWSYSDDNLERVPKWLIKEVRKIDMHQLSHDWVNGKYIVIYGRTFKYSIIAEGQGGPIVSISRKRRSGK